jgi:hypothetical protein
MISVNPLGLNVVNLIGDKLMTMAFEDKSYEMQRILDGFAFNLYHMTVTDSHRMFVCVSCKQDVPDTYGSQADDEEYWTSGLCPTCFGKH